MHKLFVGWSHISFLDRMPWSCQTNMIVYSDAEYKWLSNCFFRMLIELKVLLLKIKNWNIGIWVGVIFHFLVQDPGYVRLL